MMKHLLSALAVLALLSLASCQGSGTDTGATPADSLHTTHPLDSLADGLTGKTFLIDYGQMKAEVFYGADTLHWKTFTPAGEATGEASEVPAYEPLGNGRYFTTWMEADGTAVSQLLDLKEAKIEAFILGPAEAGASRSPLILTGSLTEVAK